jgi:hypothetical protein
MFCALHPITLAACSGVMVRLVMDLMSAMVICSLLSFVDVRKIYHSRLM